MSKMRTNPDAKFSHQHRSHQSEDRTQGFTLIELLVVIVITGILGAIALPNFLNQDVKAKQTEAKQNIALINKSQNAYRAERSAFANTFSKIAIGSVVDSVVPGQGTTNNYTYTITAQDNNPDTVSITASVRDTALKSYSGGSVRFSNIDSQSVIGTILCETIVPGNAATAPNTVVGNSPTCAATEKNIGL
jgi:type IV pilus assembly protein PilA